MSKNKLPEAKRRFDQALQEYGPLIKKEAEVTSAKVEQSEATLLAAIKNFGLQAEDTSALIQGVGDENPLRSALYGTAQRIKDRLQVFQKETSDFVKLMRWRSKFDGRWLVYLLGPVKVGKTTLLRYFAKDLSNVQFFILDENERLHFVPEENLEIKGTEATFQLQGALTEHFAIIEAPGVMSMNEKNEKLARSYHDAADLLVCCTPAKGGASLSELNILTDRDQNIARKRERQMICLALQASGKAYPQYINGQRVRPEEMFTEQELKDVDRSIREAFAQDKDFGVAFASTLRLIPLSVHLARENEANPEAYKQSGIVKFYDTLTEMLKYGEAVKIKKQMPEHRLRETVDYIHRGNSQNSLRALQLDLDNLETLLRKQREEDTPKDVVTVAVEVRDRIVRDRVVRKLVDKCVSSESFGNLAEELTNAVNVAIKEILEPKLRLLTNKVEKSLDEINREALFNTPTYKATYEGLPGLATVAVMAGTTGFGFLIGVVGASVIAALFPPAAPAVVGPLIATWSGTGAVVGLFAGVGVSSKFSRKVGDNAEEMVANITNNLATEIPERVKKGFDVLVEQYHKPVQAEISRLRGLAKQLEDQLLKEVRL